MAGHYGNEKVTVQAQVIFFDKENGIIVLKGSVAGHNGAFGKITIIK